MRRRSFIQVYELENFEGVLSLNSCLGNCNNSADLIQLRFFQRESFNLFKKWCNAIIMGQITNKINPVLNNLGLTKKGNKNALISGCGKNTISSYSQIWKKKYFLIITVGVLKKLWQYRIRPQFTANLSGYIFVGKKNQKSQLRKQRLVFIMSFLIFTLFEYYRIVKKNYYLRMRILS